MWASILQRSASPSVLSALSSQSSELKIRPNYTICRRQSPDARQSCFPRTVDASLRPSPGCGPLSHGHLAVSLLESTQGGRGHRPLVTASPSPRQRTGS